MKTIEEQTLDILRRPVVHYGAVVLDELEANNKGFTRTEIKDMVKAMMKAEEIVLGRGLALELPR